MDETNKLTDNNDETPSEKSVKTTAVDTGRRIDIHAQPRPTTVLRSRHEERKPKERRPRREDLVTQPIIEEKIETPVEREPVRESVEVLRSVVPMMVEPTEFDESGDFASLLLESEQGPDKAKNLSVRLGDKVSGTIIHIGKDHSFVSLDAKLEVAIATIELQDSNGELKYHMGDHISGYVSSVTGGVTISKNMAQTGVDDAMLMEAVQKRIPVEGKVIGVNKGGFDIQISGKRAFCPVGQIDSKFVEDTASFIGRTLTFLVERVEEGGRNIVVSRRNLLDRQRKEQALETLKDLEVGKKYDAVITRVADFGAFADIGGLEGLIPRSEIAHGHIDKVSDVISSNDRVEVVVLSFEINKDEPSKSRISFSLKKTKEDPFEKHWSAIKEGTTLEGKVVRLESFGAFVELFPGIDGLIHISELSENRVAHPKDVLSIGDPVSVRVVSVNDAEKRIGLSLREAVVRKKSEGATATAVKVERGQKASGVVSRIERYGVFLELESGGTALLPQSETGLPKNADLAKSFGIGSKLDVAVIDVDSQNRIRVSLLARQQMEERDSFLQFHTKENARQGGFGTFADLLKKRS